MTISIEYDTPRTNRFDVPSSAIRKGGMHVSLKRCIDFFGSIAGLIMLSPLLVLISVLILSDGQGVVLFRQRRNGLHGMEFEILKFRTMRVVAGETPNTQQACRGDQRITPIGAILRRLSLDELPQLYNVLRGDMSLVGPRPHAVEHNIHYGFIIEDYALRHMVKPGITGWAQINGFRGRTTIAQMTQRLEHDLHYIAEWSLWFDIKIIFLTACTVFFHKHAY